MLASVANIIVRNLARRSLASIHITRNITTQCLQCPPINAPINLKHNNSPYLMPKFCPTFRYPGRISSHSSTNFPLIRLFASKKAPNIAQSRRSNDSMGRAREPEPNWLTYAAYGICTLMGAVWVSGYVSALLEQGVESYCGKQSLMFRETEGTILSKDPGKSPSIFFIIANRAYKPTVTYKFELDGKVYYGNRIRYGSSYYTTKEKSEKELEKFEVNSTVKVYYKHDDPTKCVLQTGDHTTNFDLFVNVTGSIISSVFFVYGYAKFVPTMRAYLKKTFPK